MSEQDIESYMQQFNVDKATAIQEIDEIFKIQTKEIEEVYEDIIRSSYSYNNIL
ncbi:TPA: hypothetical protein ACXDAY_002175 [Clostridium botulinum]|uniref:hypothetical protein n=1 Tax=Clostridium botulinum TaxID=1491 RepID=UPI0004B64740|nr:hypothetical protein [Clostridium botulinum]APH21070.1 hypothetical protein NPD1_4194 [Clostridium botulinum]APQ71338.1 hypothetical protein RSJ8_4151 [Clostridium botulinum]APR02566.1 hypothetical protein RSJ2_4014 [Clostridium botulinum]